MFARDGHSDWAGLRLRMVEEQIRKRGISSPAVIAALERVPRHLFVPQEIAEHAYEDKPLAIGEEQTISQPYIVAAMTDALELCREDRVLEIGTGSGYQAAVLAELAREVVTMESRESLAQSARERLKTLGYSNICVESGDGTLGWPDAAPFNGILIAAAAPAAPPPLIEQLAEAGRLVIPIGKRESQMLKRLRKIEGQIQEEPLFPCQFVPLQGRHGWPAA